jgi:hypothetical protein
MSSSSASAPPTSITIPSTLSKPISQKLTKTNYPLWRAQVLPAVRGAQLEGFLTGIEKAPKQHIIITNDNKTISKEINPAYVSWVTQDQAVLGTYFRRLPGRLSCTSLTALQLLKRGVLYLICTLRKHERAW